MIEYRIPGTLYADNVGLLASDQRDTQLLTIIWDQEATGPGLNFCAEKLGIWIFNGSTIDAVSIQHD